MAACRARTFGGFSREIERVIEPSLRKRLWARFTKNPVGQPAVSDTWTKPDAYMADIELASA
jgi:hypothetical protein